MDKVRYHSLPASLLGFVLAIQTSAVGQSSPGVFTQHYDNARTGRNNTETILTPKNVTSSTFGKLFSFTVDGQIYAQPLYVANVSIPGQGTHNVAYVATQLDSVFAFDADTGVQLWQDNFTDLAQGIGPVPCGTDGGHSDISCGVYPHYGITGTPVIDPTTQTMYLIARTYDEGAKKSYQALHALDITTGAEKLGGPVQIQGSVPGTGAGSVKGVVSFSSLADIQRAGLLLQTNNRTGRQTVYIAWAGARHGWIMGYDAQTLQQTAIFNTTPNATIGGVWQSGNGLAAGNAGYVYASVGDAIFDADSGGPDYGDSLLTLDGNLKVVDYFTPMDQGCRYPNDFDLGSSGPMLLPAQPGQYPLELVASGKGGSPCDSSGFAPIYLANRKNLGKYNPLSDNVIQEISGSPAGYWSSPTLWRAGTQWSIYYAGENKEGGSGDYLKMYNLTNGQLSSTPVSQSSNLFPMGATPSSSGNGNTNGIIWATLRQEPSYAKPGHSPAVLYAYDATNVATMLYNSTQNAQRDQGGCANKFQVPVVVNGKVYVYTQNEVDVFGLLGTPPPAPNVYLSRPCYTFDEQTVGTTSTPRSVVVTNSGNANLSLGTISIRGLNASDFTQTNNCPSTLAPNAHCTIRIIFTPSAIGPRVAQVMIPDNAPGNPHNIALTGRGE